MIAQDGALLPALKHLQAGLAKASTDRQVVDGPVSVFKHHPARRDQEVGSQNPIQLGSQRLRGAGAGKRLVEVSDQQKRRRRRGDDPAQAVKVGFVVLPLPAVSLPGADMGIRPGDANAEHMDWSGGGGLVSARTNLPGGMAGAPTSSTECHGSLLQRTTFRRVPS